MSDLLRSRRRRSCSRPDRVPCLGHCSPSPSRLACSPAWSPQTRSTFTATRQPFIAFHSFPPHLSSWILACPENYLLVGKFSSKIPNLGLKTPILAEFMKNITILSTHSLLCHTFCSCLSNNCNSQSAPPLIKPRRHWQRRPSHYASCIPLSVKADYYWHVARWLSG